MTVLLNSTGQAQLRHAHKLVVTLTVTLALGSKSTTVAKRMVTITAK